MIMEKPIYRKVTILGLILLGAICYALPFIGTDFFGSYSMNGLDIIIEIVSNLEGQAMSVYLLPIAVVLLVIEAVLIIKTDFCLLKKRQISSDTNHKFIALLPCTGAVLLIIWMLVFKHVQEFEIVHIRYGMILTILAYIANAAATYLFTRRFTGR